MASPDDGSQYPSVSSDIQKAIEAITQHAPAANQPGRKYPIDGILSNDPKGGGQGQKEPAKEKYQWLPFTNFIVQVVLCVATIGAFIAAGIYAVIAVDQRYAMEGQWSTMISQWMTMRDTLIESQKQTESATVAAKAAKSAADIAAKSLEATDRPWIQVTDASVTTPLTFEGNKISVATRLTVKSVGNSAAMQIGPKWQLIVSKGAGTVIGPIIEKQKEVCSQKRVGAFLPLTLFPGQSSKDVWADALQFNALVSDISDGISEFPNAAKTKVIYPILVGCIDYQSSFGTHHQSGFAYSLQTNGYFVVGRNVPVERLAWVRYAFSGFDVN